MYLIKDRIEEKIMFLYASLGLNIALTVLLAVVYYLLSAYVNRKINKNRETMKSGIIWLYFALLVILVVFVGLALWFFNVDLLEIVASTADKLLIFVEGSIGAIVGSIVTIFLVVFIIKIVGMLIDRASQKEGPTQKRVKTILKLVESITKYVVEIVAILVILALWGVNVLPALAGLGILGLVVGLGAQSLIKDFISGFFIIFEHHFDVGDIIEVNGFKGEVIDIGLKTTRIKNWKQDIKIIGNGSISELMNYSISDSIAVVKFGIAYKEDAQKVIDILRAELPKYREQYPDIIEDPNVLGVTDLADSSVNMTVIVKTHTEKQYAVERGIRKSIKEILDKNGIEIPFPQVVVHKTE